MDRGERESHWDMPDASKLGYRSRVVTRQSEEGSSADHMRKLEALFSGGGAASLAESRSASSSGFASRASAAPRVFASPRKSLGRAPSKYRLRLERLRIARDLDEIKEAADAFLEFHQPPDDWEVLCKLLLHPSESVLRSAMGQISALILQGRVESTVILSDRLKELAGKVQESATLSYIQGLQSQIARMPTRRTLG